LVLWIVSPSRQGSVVLWIVSPSRQGSVVLWIVSPSRQGSVVLEQPVGRSSCVLRSTKVKSEPHISSPFRCVGGGGGALLSQPSCRISHWGGRAVFRCGVGSTWPDLFVDVLRGRGIQVSQVSEVSEGQVDLPPADGVDELLVLKRFQSICW
jgi:hypothetical protein